VLLPTLILYRKFNQRKAALIFLGLVILESVVYLITVTSVNNYSTMITLYSSNEMFNALYRRPFGPIGYFAFGALLSIFYYEYSQSKINNSSDKSMFIAKNTVSYKVLAFFSKSKKRCLLL
jgi:hypothetical protein